MNNVKIIKGNLFTTNCQTIVNTVNCIGVMGAGIALEFKYRYPIMYEKYVELCRNRQIDIGKLWLYNKEIDRKWVLNFPTKRDWKRPSKIEYLEKGLEKFLQTYEEKGIKSIAFPLLGASNGGIKPEVSQQIMEKYLSLCNIEVEIYHYSPTSKDDLIDTFIEAITYSSPKEIQQLSGLSKHSISKLRKIVENQEVPSLMRLGKIRGVGKETTAKAYKLAVNYKKQPVQASIFNTNLSKEMVAIQKEINKATEKQTKFDKEKVLSALDMLQQNIQIMQKEIMNIRELVQ